MNTFDFSVTEMSVLLISLIQRRNNVQSLLNIESPSESYKATYMSELATVESLLEKFFPGSVENIKSAA